VQPAYDLKTKNLNEKLESPDWNYLNKKKVRGGERLPPSDSLS
jgi:hypothetical protein